jgi:hypothetical protein
LDDRVQGPRRSDGLRRCGVGRRVA